MRRPPLVTLLLALLVLPACLTRAARPSPETLDSVATALLESVEHEGSLTSAFVVDAVTGEILYAHHEQTRLLPASTMKVVSTSAALSAFGPDFRFHTPVRLEGTQLGNLFLGDLVVEASGDPSLGSWRFASTSQACEQLAEALEARGIRQWWGAVRVDHAEEGPYGTFGPGWAWDDAAYYYSAAPTPFVFHENVVDLTVTRPEGQDCQAPALRPLEVHYTPAISEPLAVVTSEPGASEPGLDCVYERSTGGLRCLWRSTRQECPRTVTSRFAVKEPRGLFTACLEEALSPRGLWHVPVPPGVAAVPSATRSEPLVDLVSPPLSELVKATNKRSLNLYADRLGLRFTREREGRESFPLLREAMAGELARRGISPRLLRPVDGSGLSRYNLASSRGLVEVLATSLREPYAAALLDSLPVAGMDGTLAGVALELRGRIRAKTGSLTGHKAYVGLAERPLDAEHPRVVFALMLGNMDEQPTLSPTQVFERFAEALVMRPLR